MIRPILNLSSRSRWTVISCRIEAIHSTADPGVPKNSMAYAVGLEPIARAGLGTLRFHSPLWLFDTTAYNHALRDPHVAHDFHFRLNHPSRPAQDHVSRAEVSSDRVPGDHWNGPGSNTIDSTMLSLSAISLVDIHDRLVDIHDRLVVSFGETAFPHVSKPISNPRFSAFLSGTIDRLRRFRGTSDVILADLVGSP
jgi:hypothetical protein